MESVMVVTVLPVSRHVPDLLQAVKYIAVQHLSAVSPVESLDIGVLRWLSWLDVIQPDALGPNPLCQRVRNELRPVVQTYGQRGATYFHELVQCPDNSGCGQAGVNLNAQRLPVELVDNAEGAKLAPRP